MYQYAHSHIRAAVLLVGSCECVLQQGNFAQHKISADSSVSELGEKLCTHLAEHEIVGHPLW